MSLLRKDELCEVLRAEIKSTRYALEFNDKMSLVINEIQKEDTTIEYSNTLLVGLYNWVCSFCLTGNRYAEFLPKSTVDCRDLKKHLDNQLSIFFPEKSCFGSVQEEESYDVRRDRQIGCIYALGREGIFHLPDDFETDINRMGYCLTTPMPKLQELAPKFLKGYEFLTQLNKKIRYYEQREALFSDLDDGLEKENMYRGVKNIFIAERNNYIQEYKEEGAEEECLDAILNYARNMTVSLKINEERSWFIKIINAIIAFCTCSDTEVEDRTLKIANNFDFFANPTATTQTAKDLSEILNSQYVS